MKSNTFKEYVQPIVVLVAICLVITFALAYVNSITAPIIADNAAKAADNARKELLPSANSFTPLDEADLIEYTLDAVFVTECSVADNGGMVVTVSTKSFGGAQIQMIGIDAEGKFTGVKVMSHADTKGLGTKAHDAAYTAQYIGMDTLANAANIKGDGSVTFISGATISSNGLYQGMCAALEQYKAVGGAN